MTASLFSVLGVSPQLGRRFVAGGRTRRHPAGRHPRPRGSGSGASAATAAIVGTDGHARRPPHEIVGVMPAGFACQILAGRPNATALWLPFTWTATDLRERTYRLSVVARLRPESPPRQRAQAEMTAWRRQSAPDAAAAQRLLGRVVPLQEARDRRKRSARLLPLGGAVAFLLLIACANVAGLLVAAGSRSAGPNTPCGRPSGPARGRHRPAAPCGESAARHGGMPLRRRAGRVLDRSPRRAQSGGLCPGAARDASTRSCCPSRWASRCSRPRRFGLLPALGRVRDHGWVRWIQAAGHRATGKGGSFHHMARKALVAAQVGDRAHALHRCRPDDAQPLRPRSRGRRVSTLLEPAHVPGPVSQAPGTRSELPPGPRTTTGARASAPTVDADVRGDPRERLAPAAWSPAPSPRLTWLPMNGVWG